MREITSKDNKIVKLCEQLAQKKYRDKLACYLIEGENLVEEAVKNGAEIQTVLVREGYSGKFSGLEDVAFALDKIVRQAGSDRDQPGNNRNSEETTDFPGAVYGKCRREFCRFG